MTNRRNEAAATRKAAAVEYTGTDAKLIGTTDWYCVKNTRGKVAIRRERDIQSGEVKLTGPYFTKSQAQCEKSEAQWVLTHPEAK